MKIKLSYAAALKESLKHYSWRLLSADIKAGIVVGLVALPLGLALAVAIDVPPQHGLFTIITAGIIVALLGGSKFQVTGPTAAFVVVLVPIVHKFGLMGLLYATFLAGIALVGFSVLGIGKVIRMIPFPVTTGFTTGIAFVLFFLQLKDFLGLQIVQMPEQFMNKLEALTFALPTLNPSEFAVGLLTLSLIVGTSRFVKKTPAPIIGLFGTLFIVESVRFFFPEFQVATIASRFQTLYNGQTIFGIPPGPPSIVPFWNQFTSFASFWSLTASIFPAALTIAILGAIESLLSAVVADTMTQTQHDPDSELFAQGVGNIIAPFFGGIPATGAIARTATNIRYGAISPFASVAHGVFIFLCLVLIAPLASLIPMASLSALLMVVAYNLADIKHVKTIFISGTKQDKIVLTTCFALTVMIDMTVGVSVGVLLAALLFVDEVSKSTLGHWEDMPTPSSHVKLPRTIQLYEIEGPLFFGAAERAISSLQQISFDVKVVILDLRHVPIVDITALTALESSMRILSSSGRQCYACHLNLAVYKLVTKHFEHSGLKPIFHIVADRETAIQKAMAIVDPEQKEMCIIPSPLQSSVDNSSQRESSGETETVLTKKVI